MTRQAATTLVSGPGKRQQCHMLPDGRRLHLQDGPIDLIVEASGAIGAVAAAYAAASARFDTVLDELCVELTELRRPAAAVARRFDGPVARRMETAVCALAKGIFLTPMAAVAGAVADEILQAMVAAGGASLTRAYVNNGGDIALHLGPGTEFKLGLVDRPDRPGLFATAAISAADTVRGVATSGTGGRSFSLGIADAVTILARTSAQADAAATVVANAVDLPGHPVILRVPARELQPDSDLGGRLVTCHVPALTQSEIATALARGLAVAEGLCADGLIAAAALHLQGVTRFTRSIQSVLAPSVIVRPEGIPHG